MTLLCDTKEVLVQDTSLQLIFSVHVGWFTATSACLLCEKILFAQVTAKGFVLIQTKEVSMRPEDVKRVFQNSAEDLVEWITKGNFLFLFFFGDLFCFVVVAPKYHVLRNWAGCVRSLFDKFNSYNNFMLCI